MEKKMELIYSDVTLDGSLIEENCVVILRQAYILRHGKDLIAYPYITPLKKTFKVPDFLSFVFFSPAKLEITKNEMPLQISWSLKNFIRIYNFYLYYRNRSFLFRNGVLFSCR